MVKVKEPSGKCFSTFSQGKKATTSTPIYTPSRGGCQGSINDPVFAFNDAPDRRMVDIIEPCDLSNLSVFPNVTLAYFFHLRFVEFSVGGFVAFMARSTLLKRVFHVFGIRTEKQVGRSYASRVIASMTDKKSVWDWPVLDLPCQPVSKFNFVAIAKTAIATAFKGSDPIPATICFLDFSGESKCFI